MNITRFMGHLDNMARQNQFEVDINCSPKAKDGSTIFDLHMRSMLCKTASFPSRSFETASFGEVPSGAMRPFINKVIYSQDATFTFMCNNTMEDKQKLELWQEHIFGNDYSLRYPTEYEGTIQIKQLDRSGDCIYAVTLHNAFPQLLASQQLDMSSSTIQTFSATFAYRSWSSAYENIPEGSLLGQLAKVFQKKIKSKIKGGIEDMIYKERTGPSIAERIRRI